MTDLHISNRSTSKRPFKLYYLRDREGLAYLHPRYRRSFSVADPAFDMAKNIAATEGRTVLVLGPNSDRVFRPPVLHRRCDDEPAMFGQIISARTGSYNSQFTIVRNDNHVNRRCSSAHCQATVAVMRFSPCSNRGWCHTHWPEYIGDELSALVGTVRCWRASSAGCEG